ncbi:hypothetical protein JTB14_026018 [Gonioctena quinquepunctata]|nr:hypothetical protein JTB14_026018 [Gonioctena quinquepunctata]
MTSIYPKFFESSFQILKKIAPFFDKLGHRKNINGGRIKEKYPVYTDTPEKDAIGSESEARENKRRAWMIKRNMTDVEDEEKKKNIAKKKSENESPETSEDKEEYYCLVYMESYSSSKPGEQWLQCSECKFWAHEEVSPS